MRNLVHVVLVIGLGLAATIAVAQQAAEPTKPAAPPAPAQPTEATPPALPAMPEMQAMPPMAGPRMELSPKTFDFGTVWENQPATGEFTIKNVGNAPLTITSRSSCGCTVATKPKSPLAPGEETKFTISYSTKRKGRANKAVTLTTNDPSQKQAIIKVTGEVKSVFEAKPNNTVIMRDLDASSAETQKIQLKNTFGKPVHLKLRPDANRKGFAVALDEVKAGEEYELSITTVPPLAEGWNRTTVVLETDVKAVPTVQIPVNANVPPRVALIPPRIYVLSNAERATTRNIRVQYRNESPLEILEVKTEPEMKWELIDAPTGAVSSKMSYHTIRLTMPPFSEFPKSGGKVTIKTNDGDPKFQTIEVPITPRITQARAQRLQPGQPAPAPKVMVRPGAGTAKSPAVAGKPSAQADKPAPDPEAMAKLRALIAERIKEQGGATEEPKPAEPKKDGQGDG